MSSSHLDTSKMKKIATTFLLLLLFGLQAFSQHGKSSSEAYRKHGDTQYQYHYYQSAIDFYKKSLKKSPDVGYVMLQLAKSNVKINQPAEAEKWFIQARENHGPFTLEDYNQYARVLVTLKKRNQAEALLESILEKDPYAYLARASLSDLRDFQKYYLDSASVDVDSLSINTPVAEFAPAFYKEGIVFTSARLEGPWKKRYHWDNSHFLNLYYTPKANEKSFGNVMLLQSERNTRYHEGPAMFYSKYQRMILNRNQTATVEGKENVYERRLALYDGVFDENKSQWDITPLPFNEVTYSYAHPSISEDGNTLYFISDKPGGYGGTDIYRVVRTDSVWEKPFNLGPVVNSAENEVFPFFINNTLYFASNGHGGLGGTDLFLCTKTINGFSPPVNLGYPINSTADDFSLIATMDERNGYFASARNGNDDIYSFNKPFPKVNTLASLDSLPLNMAARVFKGDDNQPLANANVIVITFGEKDQELTTDSVGMVDFILKEGNAFHIIGTKDNLRGMTSGTAEKGKNDKASFIIPVPLYGENPTQVLAIGLVTNTRGELVDATKSTVKNKRTGEQIPIQTEKGVLTFKGEHGEDYNITVSHDDYLTTLQELLLPEDGPDIEKFTVILEDKPGLAKILPLATIDAVKIAENIKAGKSTLLLVDTDKGTSKVFIKSGESLSEITERDSLLYLQTHRGNELLGKGMLFKLRKKPSAVLKGLERSHVTLLRNIYFDFDKSNLDNDDKKYIRHLKSILDLDHTSRLIIAGHADDRGTDAYNIKLSQRRVQAVSKYLISLGIPKNRIVRKAFGESLPAVKCFDGDCSEEDHQMNRRAEFVVSQDDIIAAPSVPLSGLQ